jgi:glycerol-3-phosphate dehydrogenase
MTDSPTVLVVGGGATGTGIARDPTLRGEGGTCGAEWARRPRGISRGFFTVDHAADGVGNSAGIVDGKPTTYRKMAAAAPVCDTLGIDMASETVTRPLPGADDTRRLDELVGAYDGQGPTDADVSQHP